MNDVSDRWNSFARAWHCSVVSPSASNTTASGLPAKARGANTSTTSYSRKSGPATAPTLVFGTVTTVTRAYVSRLAGLTVFDPNGDRVGKVRDVVVALRVGTAAPRVLGLVVEVVARRRIFVPMGRVTAVDPGAV